MDKIPKDDAFKQTLQLLFFQLEEQLKEPPITIDIYSWKENIETIMEDLKKNSSHVHQRLDDLVIQAVRLAEQHMIDVDESAPSKDFEQSAMAYFEQIACISSEINAIKSYL